MESIRTTCQACHCECGVFVQKENGKIIGIRGDPDHPFSKGFLCNKAKASIELVYHKDRVRFPLKRVKKGKGSNWRKISWDEALDEIAERLTEIKENHGPEAIATHRGTGPRQSVPSTALLALALGTPNLISTDNHICYAPSFLAECWTYGDSITMELGPDYLNSNCIVVWGGNPLASHPPRGFDILRAVKERGTKLIVVDPRRTTLAAKSDLWLQVRPGTDAALALGMINYIIKKGLQDKKFVSEWCHGFENLEKRVQRYTPEWAEEITWIPADKIKEAARLYVTTKPAVLHHRVALEHSINSIQTLRSLAILIALAGNMDVKGGNFFPHWPEGYVSDFSFVLDRRWRFDKETEQKRIGSSEYPLASGFESTFAYVPSPLSIRAMLYGKPYQLKAIFCAGANPVVNCQNTKMTVEAFKKLDLLVVSEFFMTPTAELADYVLPVAHWLERNEVADASYMNCISARQKVIEPIGDCWDDVKIVMELVKRIPWADKKHLPWKDMREFNDWKIKSMGITFDDLKEKGTVSWPEEYRKYEKKGFRTPTGKVELYSTMFEKCGYDPLPSYREPPESPASSPELMETYPLILITGCRDINYFHSEGRQLKTLRKIRPDPMIEIHSNAAKAEGIKDGDWVWIESPRGDKNRVKLRAKVTPDIHPQVVHAEHAWWFPEKPGPEHGLFESNINVVTSSEHPRDLLACSVPTRGTLCKIYKAKSTAR